MKQPITAYQETLGMIYFARMLNKIRLNQAQDLHEDFHANLGKGLDGRCSGFLRVSYEDLASHVAKGGSDEDILNWCFENGRKLDEGDVFIWNSFVSKYGWRDGGSEMLIKRKKESGLENLDELQTFVDYFDYDEGRKG